MPVAERFQGANVIDAGRLSPYWGEHAARYAFALPYVQDRSVLDIACGTGFGLGLMKSVAAQIVGVDVDAKALSDAKTECGANTYVMLADGLSLPFAEDSFDTITSFETLEHIRCRDEFLAELKRLMKQNAVLLLSTPNANYTKPVNGRPSNPFHIHEYKPAELRNELGEHFAIERFVGQALRADFGIPPFYDAQELLPTDVVTRSKLFGWKALNKLPIGLREAISDAVWNAPFYPRPSDYVFAGELIDDAPVLVAVCRKAL